ncbi:MAG: DUF6067 family protein, partial [Acidobacteriia bacterium]|nr:DUF6067 family protein [Terriglobia bacterium]
MIYCSVCSRRDFAKLVVGLLGTAGSGFACPRAAAEGAQTAATEALRVLPYGIGPCWPTEYGDVRVRIRVPASSGAVWAHIPWRRRDLNPAEKDIFLIDAQTGQRVKNVARLQITREFGDIVFQPQTAPGVYDLYYMPYQITPRQWDYRVQYDHPRLTADPAWLELYQLQADRLSGGDWMSLPHAEVLEIQARSEFDRFDPMEVIATREESQKLLGGHSPQDFLLFPEERQFPIRMTEDLPRRWITKGPGRQFHGEARRGEFFVFQVGIFACRNPVEGLSIEYSDLKSAEGSTIPANAIRCFNTGGTDWLGRRMTKDFTLPPGKIGALWFGVQIPKETAPGDYRGTLVMRMQTHEATRLELSLRVSSKHFEDAGDSELWRHSRLRWLDSTVGIDDEVTAPYTAMSINGPTVGCRGRQVRFAASGLPDSI